MVAKYILKSGENMDQKEYVLHLEKENSWLKAERDRLLEENVKLQNTINEMMAANKRAGRKRQFNDVQIEQIYIMHERGDTMKEIGEYMGCSAATISRTLKKRNEK